MKNIENVTANPETSDGNVEERKTETLGTALPKEMARVRELLPFYDEIPEGIFAATLMRRDLDLAAQALAEGDLPAMIAIYESLKGYSA